MSLDILSLATMQALTSFEQENMMLNEFAMALLLVVLRRVNNSANGAQNNAAVSSTYITNFSEQLVKTLSVIPCQAEYDEEAAKYFLLIEEIVITLSTTHYLGAETGQPFIEHLMTSVLSHFVADLSSQ